MIRYNQHFPHQRPPEPKAPPPPKPKRADSTRISPAKEALLAKLWESGAHRAVIAEKIGISVGSVPKICRRLGLAPRKYRQFVGDV